MRFDVLVYIAFSAKYVSRAVLECWSQQTLTQSYRRPRAIETSSRRLDPFSFSFANSSFSSSYHYHYHYHYLLLLLLLELALLKLLLS